MCVHLMCESCEYYGAYTVHQKRVCLALWARARPIVGRGGLSYAGRGDPGARETRGPRTTWDRPPTGRAPLPALGTRQAVARLARMSVPEPCVYGITTLSLEPLISYRGLVDRVCKLDQLANSC